MHGAHWPPPINPGDIELTFLGPGPILAAASLASPFTGTPATEHTMQVAIYDTVPLAPATIATIQATVNSVLEPASIRVAWTLCSGLASQDAECSPARPRDVVVRVLATHAPRAEGRWGFAVPHPPGRGFISLAFDCAADTAATLRGNWKLAHVPPVTEGHILGYMLAHEIGHLLLDDVPHASSGLFKRRLARADWSEIEHGRLTFRSHEIERLRAVARRLSGR